MARRVLVWLHRWVGLILGVMLAVLGLSGSLLVFDRELEPVLQPAQFSLPSGAAALPLETLLQRARTALPPDVGVQLRLPAQAGRPYQFWAQGGDDRQVLVNPYSGEILTVRSPTHAPFGWLFKLHSALLADETGEQVVGWLGVALLLLGISGLALWWPRVWRNALRVQRGRGRYALHYDLHRVVGALTVPLLLVAAVSGASLVFKPFTRSVLASLTGYSKPAPKPPTVTPQGERQPLDRLVATAERALPGGRFGVITLPAKSKKPVVLRKQLPGEPHPNGLNYVYVDPYSARVLRVERLADAEPGTRWFNWAYPLHTGRALGWPHQALLVLAGLAPSVLLGSAGVTWWLRRRRRQLALRAVPAQV